MVRVEGAWIANAMTGTTFAGWRVLVDEQQIGQFKEYEDALAEERKWKKINSK